MQEYGDLNALKTDKTIADVLQTRDNNLVNLFKNTFASALPLGERVAALQDEHQDSHFPIDVKLGPGESG